MPTAIECCMRSIYRLQSFIQCSREQVPWTERYVTLCWRSLTSGRRRESENRKGLIKAAAERKPQRT